MSMSENWCNQISKYRHKRGLTQKQLAELVGVTTSYIAKLERGHKDIASTDKMAKLSIALQELPENIFFPRYDRIHNRIKAIKYNLE